MAALTLPDPDPNPYLIKLGGSYLHVIKPCIFDQCSLGQDSAKTLQYQTPIKQ